MQSKSVHTNRSSSHSNQTSHPRHKAHGAAHTHRAEGGSRHSGELVSRVQADIAVSQPAAAAAEFASLGLSGSILDAVREEGYTTPTPIQALTIPPILEGRDVLGGAQTGTGKTAAFALPILHRLMNMPIDKTRRGPAIPRVLVLSPTRELATQIGDSFATYGRHTGLTHTVIFGGVNQFHQVKALHRGVDILVATPGRLMDLMEQRLVILTSVSIFVLDEADRMLDMGFIAPIRRIAAALPKTPAPRQTLMFSATMPGEIMKLADSLLHSPVKVAVTPVSSAVPLIEQRLYMVPRQKKQALLHHLLEEQGIVRAVVFTKTKHGADKVNRKLHAAGISSQAIHGNKAQNQRTRALDAFRTGRSRVLVATDVAARGLDVDGISHVFNFDLPMEAEAYVHRIGRTGRAGATGIAITFCDTEERGLLREVEKLTRKAIPTVALPANLPEPEVGHAEPERGEQRGGRGAGDSWGNEGRGKRPSPNQNRGHSHPRASKPSRAPASNHAPKRDGAHSPAKPHSHGSSASGGHAPQRKLNQWKTARPNGGGR